MRILNIQNEETMASIWFLKTCTSFQAPTIKSQSSFSAGPDPVCFFQFFIAVINVEFLVNTSEFNGWNY